MAHKLETKQAAPSVVASLVIQSAGDASSVILKTEEIREPIEVGGKTDWVVSKLKLKQICTFIGADGEPCSLEGSILESDCVEISAAHKVVVQIQIANELKAAYAAGKVSKGYTSLDLVKVVEVWDTPKNCLWRAPVAVAGAAVKAGGPVMDDSGKIVRPAA